MATLLLVGDSEGALRCDAKCHDASPETRCGCCCGGRYHALGGAAAADKLARDVQAGRFGGDLAGLAGYLTDEAVRHAVQTTLW